MKRGRLELDPAKSPGVIDTATWDRRAACEELRARSAEWAAPLRDAAGGRAAGSLSAGPATVRGGRAHGLAELSRGQKAVVAVGPAGGETALGPPMLALDLEGGLRFEAFPADAPVVDAYCRSLRPRNAPRALGAVPRLGVGCRMTTLLWPGAFKAMDEGGFAANCIQNSVRELNLLGDLEAGREPERNYAFCFGTIESGYTGSTFEGLWLAGTLAALLHGRPLSIGADADHIQIKRSDEGLARALAVVEAARYYSFFTIDPSDVLDYAALKRVGEGEAMLAALVPDRGERADFLACHTRSAEIGGRTLSPSPDAVGRLAGKFWRALEGTARLADRVAELKGAEPFDLEFAFDETPAGVAAVESVSGDEESLFVARELRRRGLPATHLAPNLGIEKGRDYRLADGLPALGERVRRAVAIAEGAGLMVDVHSADDLSPATRRAIGKAGGGRLHYKISPSLQYQFAQLLAERRPELFREWWDDALAYAAREAEGGSEIAKACLEEYGRSPDRSPSTRHEVFHQFYFAYPGRRAGDGSFPNRERLYSLEPGLRDEYRDRVAARLAAIAADVLAPG